MKDRIYWDSDCFLGWLQGEPGKEKLCHDTIEKAKKREVLIVTSALTLTEVLAVKKLKKIGDYALDKPKPDSGLFWRDPHPILPARLRRQLPTSRFPAWLRFCDLHLADGRHS